jgi:hypothetical protein
MPPRPLDAVLLALALQPQRARTAQRATGMALEPHRQAGRRLIDRWTKPLRQLLDLQQASLVGVDNEVALSAAWKEAQPTIVDVLSTEIVSRLWTALAVSCAGRERASDLLLVARNQYLGQLEIRKLALTAIVYGRSMQPSDAQALDGLRRRCERWTDMLLGYAAANTPASKTTLLTFAFDSSRCESFAVDARDELAGPNADVARRVLAGSLKQAFGDLSPAAPSRAFIASIKTLLEPEANNANWHDRLFTLADEAEALVAACP